jgi:hypothetical protein
MVAKNAIPTPSPIGDAQSPGGYGEPGDDDCDDRQEFALLASATQHPANRASGVRDAQSISGHSRTLAQARVLRLTTE